MKPVAFVRFGDVVINPEQIASVVLNSVKAIPNGYGCMKDAPAITIYMVNNGLQHTFLYDSVEARAILLWLRDRTDVLCMRERP